MTLSGDCMTVLLFITKYILDFEVSVESINNTLMMFFLKFFFVS